MAAEKPDANLPVHQLRRGRWVRWAGYGLVLLVVAWGVVLYTAYLTSNETRYNLKDSKALIMVGASWADPTLGTAEVHHTLGECLDEADRRLGVCGTAHCQAVAVEFMNGCVQSAADGGCSRRNWIYPLPAPQCVFSSVRPSHVVNCHHIRTLLNGACRRRREITLHRQD